MKRLPLLCVSHACVLSLNRSVYRRLRQQGLSLHLVVPTSLRSVNGSIDCEPAEPDDPPMHKLTPLRSHLRLMSYKNYLTVLRKQKPEVILLESDTASWISLITGIWAGFNSAKLICLTNENLSWRPSVAYNRGGIREIPSCLAKYLLNSIVRHLVTSVVVTSKDARYNFVTSGFNNVFVSPLGTDRTRFRYRSFHRRKVRQALGIRADEYVIAYFGRLVPEKGVDTLIGALSRIKELPFKLMLNKFDGSSSYEKLIRAMISDVGLADRTVEVVARHGEIAHAMCASDIVVLPSRTTRKWVEQFGRVVPEAMACGNVVIVSDSGAPKELIGSCGLVFSEGSSESLSKAILSLFAGTSKCIEMRRGAIKHSHREHSVAVQARTIYSLVKGP